MFGGGLAATLVSALLVEGLWLDAQQGLFTAIFIVTAATTVLIGRAIRTAVLRGVEAEERFRIFQEQARDGFVGWHVLDAALTALGAPDRSVVYPVFKARRLP